MTAQIGGRVGAHSSPFGLPRIWRQIKWDLFETKDVQDAITASYVWLEDEAGHIGLGFVFTLAPCWLLSIFWTEAGFARSIAFIAIGAAACGVFVRKELRDRKLCKQRRGDVFKFDSRDLDWNVETASSAFALGAAFPVAAFALGPHWRTVVFIVLIAIVASVVIARVAYWWLKRKVAFQQAGLPYLFRLANFRSSLTESSIDLLTKFSCYRNERVSLLDVLFGRDRGPHDKAPEFQHILVTGDLSAGKTSLCVGIGTEFAFSLNKCRYLTAINLVESLMGKPTREKSEDGVEFVDGLNLWTLDRCDMVIVDDLDVGASKTGGDAGREAAHLIDPGRFREAATGLRGQAPLRWLGARRSVWAIGNAREQEAWRAVIADLLGVSPSSIAVVHVGSQPAAAAQPEPLLAA